MMYLRLMTKLCARPLRLTTGIEERGKERKGRNRNQEFHLLVEVVVVVATVTDVLVVDATAVVVVGDDVVEEVDAVAACRWKMTLFGDR